MYLSIITLVLMPIANRCYGIPLVAICLSAMPGCESGIKDLRNSPLTWCEPVVLSFPGFPHH